MTEKKPRQPLGRGLDALLGSAPSEQRRQPPLVPIHHVRPHQNQPRKTFENLDDLAHSIRQHGVIQPLVVRPDGENRYIIIAGERRWRAAQKAGLHEVPVVVSQADSSRHLVLALVENMQREDLNPVEEAAGYQELAQRYGLSHGQIAEQVGRSRSAVANAVRLLALPESVLALLRQGELSAGHGRALVGAEDPSALAREVVAKALSVRELEARVSSQRTGTPRRADQEAGRSQKSADVAEMERRLEAALGLQVTLQERGGAGRLIVHYDSSEQREAVLTQLLT